MQKVIRILIVVVELWAHPFMALLALAALYKIEQLSSGSVLTEFPGNTAQINPVALTGLLVLFGGLRFARFGWRTRKAGFWSLLKAFQRANYPALVTAIIVLGFYFPIEWNMVGIIYLPALLLGSAIAGTMIVKRARRQIAELNGTDTDS